MVNIIDNERLYRYKCYAERAAKQLCYTESVIKSIRNCKTESEVSLVMNRARLSQ